jgi:hypothetical protein
MRDFWPFQQSSADRNAHQAGTSSEDIVQGND